ncbi:hypothetical protein BU25DRAFT_300236, partial [Macroventuria anomochaeta]
GSPKVFAYAKDTLERYLKSHSRCGVFRRPDWVPTRLLDLRSLSSGTTPTSQVRLVETSDTHVRGRMQHSHCWGGDESWVTTNNNIDDLYQSCPVSKFPCIFQQAMSTILSLGINNIWIDCYCIIQKDENDWEHEASEMHMVYTNYIINIGAANS